MRTTIRLSLAAVTTLSLLMLALVAAAPVSAQGSGDQCRLRVRPGEAPPGSEFVFSGRGYQPTRLVLRRAGSPARTIPVQAGEGDSFSIRLIAGEADAGKWRATAIEPDGCRASVTFTVGLPPTSTALPGESSDRGLLLAGLAGLGGLFILSSLAFAPRLARSVRTR